MKTQPSPERALKHKEILGAKVPHLVVGTATNHTIWVFLPV
jgi:hypothetical protein